MTFIVEIAGEFGVLEEDARDASRCTTFTLEKAQ